MKACPFCARDIDDAAAACEHCNALTGGPTPATPSRRTSRRAVVLAAALILAVGAVSGTTLLRAKATQPAPGEPADAPIALTDLVESLPPGSWKAVPLTLPHDGVLEVEVGVARGNPVNVFVTTPADMQEMLGDDLATVPHYPGFGATMTKRFARDGQLTAGNYYLVIQEPSVGQPSAVASAVSIQANLRR